MPVYINGRSFSEVLAKIDKIDNENKELKSKLDTVMSKLADNIKDKESYNKIKDLVEDLIDKKSKGDVKEKKEESNKAKDKESELERLKSILSDLESKNKPKTKDVLEPTDYESSINLSESEQKLLQYLKESGQLKEIVKDNFKAQISGDETEVILFPEKERRKKVEEETKKFRDSSKLWKVTKEDGTSVYTNMDYSKPGKIEESKTKKSSIVNIVKNDSYISQVEDKVDKFDRILRAISLHEGINDINRMEEIIDDRIIKIIPENIFKDSKDNNFKLSDKIILADVHGEYELSTYLRKMREENARVIEKENQNRIINNIGIQHSDSILLTSNIHNESLSNMVGEGVEGSIIAINNEPPDDFYDGF